MATRLASNITLPSVPLKQVEKAEDNLRVLLYKYSQMEDSILEKDLYTRLCIDIADLIQTNTYPVSHHSIKKSLSSVLGRKINYSLLKWIFGFVAANIKEFKLNELVMPVIVGEKSHDWVPVKFIDVKQSQQRKDVLSYFFEVVYGRWYGVKFRRDISYGGTSWSYLIWKLGLGDSKSMELPRDFIGLHCFVGSIYPINNYYSFSKVELNSYFDTLNRKLIKERMTDCILQSEGYSVPCATCKAHISECHRATRFTQVGVKV